MKKLMKVSALAVGTFALSQGAFAQAANGCGSIQAGDSVNAVNTSGTAVSFGTITTNTFNEVCIVSNAIAAGKADISIGDGTTAVSVTTDNTGVLKIGSSATTLGSIGSSTAALGILEISGSITGAGAALPTSVSGATNVFVHTLQIGTSTTSAAVDVATAADDIANFGKGPTVSVGQFYASGAVTILSGATISTSATLGASKLHLGDSASLTVSGAVIGGGLIESDGADIAFGAADLDTTPTDNVVNISAAAANIDITFTSNATINGNISNTSKTTGNGIKVSFASVGKEDTIVTGDIGVDAPIAEFAVAVDGNATKTVSATVTGSVQAQTITTTGTTGALIISGDVSGATTLTLDVPLVVQGGISASTVSTINVGANFKNGDTVINTDTSNAAGKGGWGFDTANVASSAITINMPADFTTGAMNIIVNSAAFTASEVTGGYTVGNSFFADYTVVNDTQQFAVVVSATAKSGASIASSLGLNSSDGAAIAEAVGFIDGVQAEALTVAARTRAGAIQAAKQIGVQTDSLSASTAASAQVSTSNVNVNTGRLASLRSYNPWVEGFNADNHSNQGAWGKFFGQFTSQDERDGVAGFDSDTAGFTVGYDRAINSKVNLGGSLTIADTTVEGEGEGQSSLEIKSYIFSAYGDYNTKKWFVEGLLSWGLMNSDANRKLTFGGLDQTGQASYDGNQVTAYVGYGRNYKLGAWNFIPVGSFQYTLVNNDDYNESGLGNLNLTVDQESINIAIIKAAATFNRRYAIGTDMDFLPAFRTSLGFDIAGDEANATASFQGSTAQFQSTGADIAQLIFGAGFGAGINSGDWTATLDYDLDVRADFFGHNLSLKGKWEF